MGSNGKLAAKWSLADLDMTSLIQLDQHLTIISGHGGSISNLRCYDGLERDPD